MDRVRTNRLEASTTSSTWHRGISTDVFESSCEPIQPDDDDRRVDNNDITSISEPEYTELER